MLTEKENKVYEAIKLFIKENNNSPTIRELCVTLDYKSTKSVYYYLKKLKEKKVINYHTHKQRTISLNENEKKIINKNKSFAIKLRTSDIIYQINNNFFYNYNICNGDYLIINPNKKLKDNDLGLFIIDKKYRIMKYKCVDNFFILEDKEQIILYKIDTIGKVEGVYRKM